jgi:hypothetical protein
LFIFSLLSNGTLRCATRRIMEEGQMAEREAPRQPTRHRGIYTLERGVWQATCRECGWGVAHVDRRRAATQFRTHIELAKAATRRSDPWTRADLDRAAVAPSSPPI